MKNWFRARGPFLSTIFLIGMALCVFGVILLVAGETQTAKVVTIGVAGLAVMIELTFH